MNAGEQLQIHLERFFALRQHRDEPLFQARLDRLQAFQRQRLMDTHQALLRDPAVRPGFTFLLDDVYGGRHLLPVAQEIHRALPKAMRLLPTSVMATSASALEAAIVSQELDEALALELDSYLDAPLDDNVYGRGYRTATSPAVRRRQLKLIADLGDSIDRYVRSTALRTTFRLVRRPAHAAGFMNLYDFIDRSFRVMKPVPSVAHLLQRIAADEARIMHRLFDQHPAPFKDAANE